MKVTRRPFLGTSGASLAAATALPALELTLARQAAAQAPASTARKPKSC